MAFVRGSSIAFEGIGGCWWWSSLGERGKGIEDGGKERGGGTDWLDCVRRKGKGAATTNTSNRHAHTQGCSGRDKLFRRRERTARRGKGEKGEKN